MENTHIIKAPIKKMPWQFSTTGIVLSYLIAIILITMMLNYTNINGVLIFLNIGHIGMLSLSFLALPIIALYGNYVYKNKQETKVLATVYNTILIVSGSALLIIGISIIVRVVNNLGGGL